MDTSFLNALVDTQSELDLRVKQLCVAFHQFGEHVWRTAIYEACGFPEYPAKGLAFGDHQLEIAKYWVSLAQVGKLHVHMDDTRGLIVKVLA
jgi:hypothetical protein